MTGLIAYEKVTYLSQLSTQQHITLLQYHRWQVKENWVVKLPMNQAFLLRTVYFIVKNYERDCFHKTKMLYSKQRKTSLLLCLWPAWLAKHDIVSIQKFHLFSSEESLFWSYNLWIIWHNLVEVLLVRWHHRCQCTDDHRRIIHLLQMEMTEGTSESYSTRSMTNWKLLHSNYCMVI